jgi:ATP-dependent RNA helicase DHX36
VTTSRGSGLKSSHLREGPCRRPDSGPQAPTQVRDELHGITHIVIDEIHERDRYADFMLVVLKGLLPLFPHLRVILMSATLNTDAFSSYFDQCPVLSVPGFTHPVEDFFLEEVRTAPLAVSP